MQKQGKNAHLVPILVNGVSILAAPASISKDKRTVHHGAFKGTVVNSPATCSVGDSVVIWPEADKPQAYSMSKAAFGVLSTQFLKSQGYAIVDQQQS